MKAFIIQSCFLFILLTFISPVIAQTNPYKDPSAASRIPTEKIDNQSTVKALQETLYELVGQYNAVQQGHWNVEGPLFQSLHELLGEMYAELVPIIDQVAERKVILGEAADGRPAAVAENAKLGDFPTGLLSDKQVLEILSKRYKSMSDRLAQRVELTGKSDVVTQDILIGVKEIIDMHLWKLRAFQK